MICPHCQQEHSDNADFCPNTGKEIKIGKTKNKSNILKFLLGMISVLLVITIIGVGGFIFARNNELLFSLFETNENKGDNQPLREDVTSQVEPPYSGVFLVRDDSLIEAFEHEGPPDYVSPEEFPISDDTQPLFIVWLPQIQLQYFILYDLSTGQDYDYNIATGENGILEIRPINSLLSGSYCFYQGDPFGSPVDIMHWCFNIGDVSTAINDSLDTSDDSLRENNSTQIVSSDGIINSERFVMSVEPVLRKYIEGQFSIDVEEAGALFNRAEFVIDSTLLQISNENNFCNNPDENIHSVSIELGSLHNVEIAQMYMLGLLDAPIEEVIFDEIGDRSFLEPGHYVSSNCREIFNQFFVVRKGSQLIYIDVNFGVVLYESYLSEPERRAVFLDLAQSILDSLGGVLENQSLAPPKTSSTDCSSEDVLCIGLVTDVGGEVDDKSFNQSAWEGAQQAAEQHGAAKVDYIETKDAKDYAANMQLFLDQGYDVIITVGFAMGEATAIAAAENPDTYFIGVDQFQTYHFDDDTSNDINNLVGLVFNEDHAGFLAGALAAMLTETNVLAGVYGTDLVPPVVAFKEGYQAGAAYINPDVEVISSYHPGGLDVAFTDPEWGATTAAQAIDNGADVVFGAGGKTGNGAIIAAAGYAGVYCIGVDTDQWETVSEAHPCLISSAMKLITPGIVDIMELYVAGEAPNANFFGGAGLASFHDFEHVVTPEMKEKIDEIIFGLSNGTITTGYRN